jgi:cytochrome c556
MRIALIAIACSAMLAATAAGSVVIAKVSGPAAAQIMHQRHEGMETIGNNFKTLHRELGSSSPFVPAVRTSAAQIADLSKNASGWFPAGTGPDVGKTGAKPEIWQNPQDFAAKLSAFQKAALALNAAASGNDVEAMKARYADLGGACKDCHDKYRSEMHH